jgi:aryl-alcohol dehydrogenase-like predicted oxidoreductase/predicted kinase
MRMSTHEHSDKELAGATIVAAAEAGITVFDTARAYGDNEQLLARALKRCGAERRARIVTKGGMARPGGTWVPDGRAKALLRDCEASLTALDGLTIDLYLVHAPDPRTPWRTSVRALARLVDEGLVRHVGLSNVNRRQLDEAIEIAPVSAVEVALSVYDDRALRGGIVERCTELGIAVIAHSPLGGPRRARRLVHREPLADVAGALGGTAAQVALAWLLELSPAVVAIPGARRPETARSAAEAAKLVLDGTARTALSRVFSARSPLRPDRPRTPDGEVLLVMGIPGAGKTRVAQEYVDRGYVRLNRDERGGGLRELANTLDEQLASGVRRLVLDNTYLTRAARSYVIDTARRHSIAARCVWLDTPLAQAQVNLVERLLDRYGSLPTPEQLRAIARREPGAMLPTSQMRTRRELEPPSTDEGFSRVELIPFERNRSSERTAPGVLVAAPALRQSGWERAVQDGDLGAPHLVFDWSPDGTVDALDPWVARVMRLVAGPVRSAICPHPAGPPTCWCRPPLPGLALAFAREHDVELSRSTVVGSRPAHRTLAATLGARYIAVG